MKHSQGQELIVKVQVACIPENKSVATGDQNFASKVVNLLGNYSYMVKYA